MKCLLGLIPALIFLSQVSIGQEPFYGCHGILDSTYSGPESLMSLNQELVLVCVDFADGRLDLPPFYVPT